MRKSTFTLLLCAVLLLFSVGLPLSHAQDQEQAGDIRFGVYPYETARSIYSLYAPIARRIEKKTGRKVELVSAPDQKIFTDKVAEDAFDLALVSPNTFFKYNPPATMSLPGASPLFTAP